MDSIHVWARIVHIIGFVLWTGGLLATLSLLRAHAQVDGVARETLSRVERGTAAIMELGATLAIAAGVYMAFWSPKFPNTAFGHGGWFHIKLTAVVLGVFALHGMARAKMKKFRTGTITPVPNWAVPALILAIAIIVVFGAHPTLLRK